MNSEMKERDGLDTKYEKMWEAMETLSKNLTAMSAKTNASVSAPQQARPPPTCYKCGVVGHFSNQCRTDVLDKKPEVNDSKSAFKCYQCPRGGYNLEYRI